LRIAAKIPYKDDNEKVVVINESLSPLKLLESGQWSLNRSIKVKEMATLKLNNTILKKKEKKKSQNGFSSDIWCVCF
jgi:hypothetical protein